MTGKAQLAHYGGPKLCSEPCPARGHIGAEEKAAVDAFLAGVIESGVLPPYDGDEERAYCAEFATWLGGGYADAVSSGSAAIYVALRALDLEPFGEVIIGAFTDPGGMMPILLQNQIPVIADSIPNRYCTGPEQVEALITPLTRAIIVPQAMLTSHFILFFHENWGSPESDDTGAILQKVTGAFKH